MMDYIAHTPPKNKPNLQPHRYVDHIDEMLDYGLDLFVYVLSFSQFSDSYKKNLCQTFEAALMLHDMGKLDEEIQRIFRGKETGRLPIDHIDAGVAVADEMKNELLGWLIRGHHAPGLPSKKTEKYFIKQLRQKTQLLLTSCCLRGLRHGRDKLVADWEEHRTAIVTTNQRFDEYKKKQLKSCGKWPQLSLKLPSNNLITRLMLSCLVEADHDSAACYSQNIPMATFKSAETLWSQRLQALNCYVSSLASASVDPDSKRNQIRGRFYDYCFGGELFDSRLVACSAPVGLGKTTSVMAYLLRCAIKNNSSRIFVIAPFTNIINQTVSTLRKAVVLDGEDPEKVVIAHHHKADFSSKDMRQYAMNWSATIVVTTAVQFFETLAASSPSKLRKLHKLVGAAIFVDESHACLPAELLNISWHWMRQLADDWGCYFVFSSGSMVKFWEDSYLVEQNVHVLPEIFPQELKMEVSHIERQRVVCERMADPLTRDELASTIISHEAWGEQIKEGKPSCLVILNTVQSTAAIADELAKRLGDKNNELHDKSVLHLSTALAPKDREVMLREVIRRQGECEWDAKPWYLIATSCVEAGVDLDFAIGYRETCSVTSFLQVSGRINRHGLRPYGKLYDFSIFAEGGLNKHPGFSESTDIFNQLWEEVIHLKRDDGALCSKAIRKELSRFPVKKEKSRRLLEEECRQGFQEVSVEYRIIESDTATVIVNKELVRKLENGAPVNWKLIQENSVQLWMNNIRKLKLPEIRGCQQDGIYSWVDCYEYDPEFLGIMAGILNSETFFRETGGVF